MRRSRHLVVAVAVGTLLAGCAAGSGATTGPPDPSAAPPGAGPSPDPVALIGNWTVTAADGGAGVLRLAPSDQGDLLWFDSCGVSTGTWRAGAGGLFVAELSGLSPSGRPGCPTDPRDGPAWLPRATGFRVTGKTPVLLDDQGRQVARLTPGAKPDPGPHLLPALAEPPVVTPEVRRALAPAAALPAGLTPAGRAALLGRWVPAGPPRGGPAPAYVELRDDGGWRGSDGCNGQGGRWVAGAEGAVLATAGPSTMVGCASVPVALWLSGASRAGLDGDVLVLVDAWGGETGRLRRDG
ncbi:META domain-containing protein [Micromonospora sp. MA102]|uniref:META domain-containing protein n=1 Tax=Micromonospora sp. MA102 TaxID=2952755 RepID=UPI0021C725CD|nr:META domain-containing protein [Micromonospora sp. MA102]